MRSTLVMVLVTAAACSDNAANMAQPDLAAPDGTDLASPLVGDLAGVDFQGVDFSLAPNADLAGGGGATLLRLYGGTGAEQGRAVVVAPDGNIYIAGMTNSTDGDVTGKPLAGNDAWVLKLDPQGNILWNHVFGGTLGETVHDIILSADGNPVIVGETLSSDGDITSAHGGTDAWLFSVDAATGSLRWSVTIGGDLDETGTYVREQLVNGGTAYEYTVLGTTKSNQTGNIVNNTRGQQDGLVGTYVRTIAPPGPAPSPAPNPQGSCFGSSSFEYTVGYFGDTLIGLATGGTNADLNGTTWRGVSDIFFASPGGVVQRGGTQQDVINAVLPTGEFVGATASNDFDVLCNTHSTTGSDLWFGKLTTNGFLNMGCFGGNSNDSGTSLAKLPDGRLVIVGTTTSVDGDLPAGPHTADGLVVVVDTSFHVSSSFFIGGGGGSEALRDIALAPDGTVVLVGDTGAKTGAFAGNHGQTDVWVTRLTVP